jgi:hypothetical protein
MGQTAYPRLRAKVGDPITLTTVQNQTVTGELVELDEDEHGGVRALAIRDDPQRDDPVWVRGDLIAIWRLGAAVRVPMVGQNGGLQQLSPEMLRGLRQAGP